MIGNTAQSLYGLSGDDKLYGGGGGDSLRGGKGDDYLNGDRGSDSYYYTRGDGHDTIKEDYLFNNNVDRLVLEGMTSDQVSLIRNGNDVTLHIAERAAGAGDGGSILLKAQFDDYYGRGVERVEFVDGTVWTQQMMRERLIAQAQTEGNDRIIGSNVADVLRGGKGDDYLNGDRGSDSYYYARGDGHDTIEEDYLFSSNVDRLVLEGMTSEQVSLIRNGNDVTLHIAESAAGAGDSGSVLLKAQFDDYYGRGVERVEFVDGTVWTQQTVRERILAEEQTARNTPATDLASFHGGDGTVEILTVGVDPLATDIPDLFYA